MRSSRIGKRHKHQHVTSGYFGRSFPLGHTSGSEDLYESSMESIESNNATSGLTLHPLSALNTPCNTANGKNKLQKISSADSLMSMIKNLASNRMSTSTPSSPQLSENGDLSCSVGSSGFPTPLTTPDTPCATKTLFSPRAKDQHKLVRKISSGDLGAASASSSPSMSPTRSSSQIMVEVLDPLNPRKDQESGDKACTSANPTITLEVPNFAFGKCLSPIKELPSPIPTPIPSPIPFQRSKVVQEEPGNTSSSSSSGKSTSSTTPKKTSVLNSRRSSFTAFCKKAANVGKKDRRSSGVELIKSSISTSDDDMIPLQELPNTCTNEIIIPVPVLAKPVAVVQPSPSIPTIVLTEPDHEPFDSDAEVEEDEVEEEDEEISFSVDLPEIAISPPSPRPSRKELQNNATLDEDDSEILDEESTSPGSQEPTMPMIKITIESPVESMVEESPSSPPESPNAGLKRKRPPPISIPNSNFLNNFEIVTVVTADNENELSQNISKDAMSKPDTSSVTRMSIELGEKRSKTPTTTTVISRTSSERSEQDSIIGTPVKIGKLMKQKDIAEDRKCLIKQAENISEEFLTEENNAMDSPKFLIPPEKFDSTPRSRSQSVELPDFIGTYFYI